MFTPMMGSFQLFFFVVSSCNFRSAVFYVCPSFFLCSKMFEEAEQSDNVLPQNEKNRKISFSSPYGWSASTVCCYSERQRKPLWFFRSAIPLLLEFEVNEQNVCWIMIAKVRSEVLSPFLVSSEVCFEIYGCGFLPFSHSLSCPKDILLIPLLKCFSFGYELASSNTDEIRTVRGLINDSYNIVT